MIRVLQILNSMDRGGIETTLMNIFRNIDKEKVVFDFLLQTDRECDYNQEILKLGGRIYSVTPRRKSIAKNKKELNEFFKKHRDEYKIVHMHVGSLTYIEPLKEAKKYNIPVRIIHSRNSRCGGIWIHNIFHYINKLSIQNIATYYFSCSDLAGKWLYKKEILNSDKYKKINNGIQTKKFKYSLNKREEMRKKLKCDDKLAIINVGRLHKQKNHEFLIKIFKKISEENKNAVLFLVGEGALKEKIKQQARELELEDKVIFLGKRSDVNDVLQAMDIFVMPSLYEGLPGSVVEAQGAGLPCLISDRITKEVAITDLVHYKSLECKEEEWAKDVIKLAYQNERKDTTEQIKESGFDMKDISDSLQDFYIKVYGDKDNEIKKK